MRRNVLLAVLAGVVLLPAQVWAQGTLTGVVRNKDTGEPLAGAQVSIQGTTLGQVTGDDGRYLITGVPVGQHTVVASFIGFTEGRTPRIQVVAGQTATVDFDLATQVLSLDQVVVTGIGEATTSARAPFAIGKVSKEMASTVPTTNSALASVQGKVAGAYIVRDDGEPGSGVSMVLRTPTSIRGSNTPLLVVDGVILGTSFGGTTVDLEALDIESVEVIKGAAASSLYGSRAAGGVVAITTSRGRDLNLNQTRVRVRTEVGHSGQPKLLPLATHHAYKMNAQGQFVDNNGNVVELFGDRVYDDDEVMDNNYSGPLYLNKNMDELLRAGQFNTTSVEMSHSAASTNFMVSLNQYREQGSVAGADGFTRRNFRVNLDHRLRDDFSLSVSAFHSRSTQDELTSRGALFDIWQAQPDFDLTRRDENGHYLQQPDTTYFFQNPAWVQESQQNENWRTRTLLNGDVRYNPSTWLSLRGALSYDRSDIHGYDYLPKGTPGSINDDDPSDGQLTISDEFTTTYNGSMSATLLWNTGDLSARMTGQALVEREDNRNFSARGSNFTIPGVPDLSWAADETISSGHEDIKSEGYYVQLGLDYGGKYIGDFLVRRDGSSLFGPDSRWQTYGRAAMAYRMALEPWWPIDWMTEFKLHYAVGTAGGRPGFTNQYEVWTSNSRGLPVKNTLGNRNLSPSLTIEHEAGIDVTVRNRYLLQLVYARQISRDQIIDFTVPAITGYQQQWTNSGEMTGQTYEATLEAQLMNQQNFSWRATLVADHSSSEITEWNRACIGSVSSLGVTCKGSNLGEIHGNRFLRSLDDLPASLEPYRDQFDVNDDGYVVWVGEGNTWRDGWTKDLWGTFTNLPGYPVAMGWGWPVVQVDDAGNFQKIEIGNSVPSVNFGLINSFNYRGIALYAALRGQLGGDTYNNTRRALYQARRHGDLDQAGKPDELKKPIDYYRSGLASGSWFVNSEFVEDATFLKLSEMSLQYRFNQNQLARFGLGGVASSLSLGLIGRNLFTITPYRGLDPEVGGIFFRVDQWYYPPTRTLTAIAEVTF